MKLQGTYEPSRHKDRLELSGEIPEAPDWLDDVGSEYWDRTVAILGQVRGLLTQADRDGLAAYSAAWSRWLVAYEENDNRVMKDTMVEIKHWAREFGLSPSARAAMPAPAPPEEENPLEAWAKRGQSG